ncbi:hypothetical protein AZE42_06535 [Rhizopogon vesiculosus]|uniref:Uncharacterized protein n=1 Tax=Rhizopogon vesiculosus TaxID=180088 RepID=A0A1J8QH84_9AGAM|nr:hypothetical protein AZE42_06535 [Rhizopogon vesiculosus]
MDPFLMHGPTFKRRALPHPRSSLCFTSLHADLCVPHPCLWTSDVGGESGEEGVWGTKEDERLLWKGMNTVMDYPEDRLAWRFWLSMRMVKAVRTGECEIREGEEDEVQPCYASHYVCGED